MPCYNRNFLCTIFCGVQEALFSQKSVLKTSCVLYTEGKTIVAFLHTPYLLQQGLGSSVINLHIFFSLFSFFNKSKKMSYYEMRLQDDVPSGRPFFYRRMYKLYIYCNCEHKTLCRCLKRT